MEMSKYLVSWPHVDPGRPLLRSGGVGHALGGDPPYQRGRRLQEGVVFTSCGVFACIFPLDFSKYLSQQHERILRALQQAA